MRRLFRNEKGIALVEVLIAIAVLGFIASAFLYGLATEGKATLTSREQATAESLARSQAEYIKNGPYYPIVAPAASVAYSVDPQLEVPDGWTLPDCTATAVHGIEDALQTVTITVLHGDKTVLTLTTYKVGRAND